jgi:hypothetical protein
LPTATDVLEAHGFGGDRLLRLARRIATDELRRRGAYLNHERLEDLVSYLALQGVKAAAHYDPERRQLKYGRDGGRAFDSYIADIMVNRVTDWYRSKAEGGADRRYWPENPVELNGEMSFAEPGDAFERELRLRAEESGEEMDAAEADLAARADLSEQGREGLRLIRLQVEGYKIAGQGTQIAQRIAREEFEAARR